MESQHKRWNPRKWSYGRINYQAYSDERNGLTHDGVPMPTWDNLGALVQQGWEAGAESVIDTYIYEQADRAANEAING